MYAMISAFGLLGYGAHARGLFRRPSLRLARGLDPPTRHASRPDDRAPCAFAADGRPPPLRTPVSPRHQAAFLLALHDAGASGEDVFADSDHARCASRARRSRARIRTSATPSRATASSRVSRNATTRLTACDTTRTTVPERPSRTIPPTPSTRTPIFLVAKASKIATTPTRPRIRSPRSRNRPRTSATPPPTRSSGDRTPRGFLRALITSNRTRAGAARRARPRGRTSATRGSGIRPRTRASEEAPDAVPAHGEERERAFHVRRHLPRTAQVPSPRNERRGRAGTGTGTETVRRLLRPAGTLRRVCTR